MAWLYLFLAGTLEIPFSILIKTSEGFTKILPTIGFFVCTSGSLFFLSKAMQSLPIGTAYAVWAGIGSVGTVVIGILLFKEPATMSRLLLIITLVGSIVGLNLISHAPK